MKRDPEIKGKAVRMVLGILMMALAIASLVFAIISLKDNLAIIILFFLGFFMYGKLGIILIFQAFGYNIFNRIHK